MIKPWNLIGLKRKEGVLLVSGRHLLVSNDCMHFPQSKVDSLGVLILVVDSHPAFNALGRGGLQVLGQVQAPELFLFEHNEVLRCLGRLSKELGVGGFLLVASEQAHGGWGVLVGVQSQDVCRQGVGCLGSPHFLEAFLALDLKNGFEHAQTSFMLFCQRIAPLEQLPHVLMLD